MSLDSEGDELSLKELILGIKKTIAFLFSKKLLIIVAGIVGSVVGLTYASLENPIYQAETSFVLEEDGKGSLSQYSGIASMIGIDLGGGGGGLFQGENILRLYTSRTMIEKTLLSDAKFQGRPQLLIDRYIEYNELKEKWAEKAELKNIRFSGQRFTIKHDSIISIIVKDIRENYLAVQKDKKLSIISVSVQSEDELFAKVFADKIVENVNNFYVRTKTKKSQENISILQRQADSIRRVLNASIGSTALALDANPNANPVLQVLRVPSQRRQIDVQASSAIYAEIVKNLEVSKVSLRKETPLIQVIDKPVLPLEKIKLGRLKGTIIGSFVSGFLIILVLLAKRVYLKIME